MAAGSTLPSSQLPRIFRARSTVGQLLFFGMRFYLKQAPYNDLRFRSAISLAIDRREMVQKWFAGSGDVNPWVSWPLQRWTLPQAELVTMPGYRAGEAGRSGRANP